jgi:hypothetical protein
MIINRIYEHQNLLSLWLVSFLVGLRTYQHPCKSVIPLILKLGIEWIRVVTVTTLRCTSRVRAPHVHRTILRGPQGQFGNCAEEKVCLPC